MRKSVLVSVLAGLIAASVANAAGVTELSSKEVRASVRAGNALGLSTILVEVKRTVDGQPVDVRAFDAAGIVYRILIMKNDGRLVSIIVDGKTGSLLPVRSNRVQQVRAAIANSSAATNARVVKESLDSGSNQ